MTIELGVCYYPEHWPESQWQQDAARMRELGLSWVRVGEFAWSRLEPSAGELRLEWLQRAVDTLGAAGLKVILCTPTATPPKWLVDQLADMLPVGADGRQRGFGSRRHYCFSSAAYKAECLRITNVLAESFTNNPYVYAWQLDNEYGCHDTTRSYSPAAAAAFRSWLQQRYCDIDQLNSAWGNVFWSMKYNSFAQIDLPNACVTEANPAHWLDFYRFSSEQVRSFNLEQARVLGQSGLPLLHNYMGLSFDFDHYRVGADLDIATWDSYPLGFWHARAAAGEDLDVRAYARQGDPDFQAFHHDLYRAVGRGSWWVMEQQPGSVNWSAWNPKPLPGMVQLWSLEAAAHGAEVVSYFRWRQMPQAQEQMHSGLLRPDSSLARGGQEVQELAQQLRELGPWPGNERAEIALIFDYQSHWAWQIQPQGQDFSYFALVYTLYQALRSWGQSVDVIAPNAPDLSSYKLVLAPGIFSWPSDLSRLWQNQAQLVLLGPRSGWHDDNFKLRDQSPWPPSWLDLRVVGAESLPPAVAMEADGGRVQRWLEELSVGAGVTTLRRCSGSPLLLRQGQAYYLAGWPDAALAQNIIGDLLAAAGLEQLALPAGLRCRRRGNWRFWFNYSDRSVALPKPSAKLLHGSPRLAPAAWALEDLG